MFEPDYDFVQEEDKNREEDTKILDMMPL